jgi:hypothetical protein
LGELEEVVGVFSPFTAAKATPEPVEGALNAGLWFRRIRFVNISPQPTAILATVRQKLSYRAVQNCRAPSDLRGSPERAQQ